MPNLSESEPFLSADQETLLEPLINLNRRLEFSSTKASESSNQMLYMTFKNFDFFKEVLNETIRASAISVSGANELAAIDQNDLRASAIMFTNNDLVYSAFRHMIAFGAGNAQFMGKDQELERSYDFGSQIIMDQACNTAAAMLTAANLIVEKTPDENALYQDVKNIYLENKMVKPPVEITESDGIRYDSFINRVRDNEINTNLEEWNDKIPRNKLGVIIFGSKEANAVRKNRRSKKTHGPQTTVDMLRPPYKLFAPPRLMELSGDDIKFITTTTNKMSRYLIGASKVDRAITSNPKTRYLNFLLDRLTRHNIESEEAVFKRDVNKVANRRKNLEKRK